MTIRTYLGKGLREPCSPNREAYFFGAELNSIYADDWNCLPDIMEPATTFDLSHISEYNEVCVALVNVSNAKSGRYYFGFRFYKEVGNKLLFEWEWDYNPPDGGWVYSYAFTGWCPWEINENGTYRVEIAVRGAETYNRVIYFDVIGIPITPEPPPEVVSPITEIVEWLNTISANMYSIYVEVLSWYSPFNLAANFFYQLTWAFNKLAWEFSYFNDWVVNVTDKITTFITSLDLETWFTEWKQRILDLQDWIREAPDTIKAEVEDWWQTKVDTIKGWVNDAKEFLQTQVNNLSTLTNNLQTTWDDFRTLILPTLVDITQVDTLMKSKLKEWFPFYDNLVSLWDGIQGFFADPLQWAYNKLDEFFERFW